MNRLSLSTFLRSADQDLEIRLGSNKVLHADMFLFAAGRSGASETFPWKRLASQQAKEAA